MSERKPLTAGHTLAWRAYACAAIASGLARANGNECAFVDTREAARVADAMLALERSRSEVV